MASTSYLTAPLSTGKVVGQPDGQTTLAAHVNRLRGKDMAAFTTRARGIREKMDPNLDHDERKHKCGPCDTYKAQKKTGLCVTFAGLWPTKRTLDRMGRDFIPSGLVFVEMEGGGPEQRDALSRLPFVAAAYVSLSGGGVHTVSAVSPAPQTRDDYRGAWRAVASALGVDADLAVRLDKYAKDATRWAIAAHDAEAYLVDTEDLQPFRWQDGADRVRYSHLGTRNSTLNEEAYRLAVRGQDVEDVKGAARDAGLENEEVRGTAESAERAGTAARESRNNEVARPQNVALAAARPDWGARDFSGELVRRKGDQLMVVTYDVKPSSTNPLGGRDALAYVVNPSSGLWAHDQGLLREWLTEIARDLVVQAFDTLEAKTATKALRQAKRLKETAVNEAIRRIPDVQRGVNRDARLVEADKRDLNPYGYLGTPSGVVDLAAGTLLPPEQGRRHKVTRSTGVALPPDDEAEHWGVDALLGHYPTEVAGYVWKWVARSLWGLPPQEFLMFVGKSKWGGEGKTTVKETMLEALGGYAGTFSEAMTRQRREGGPTAELQPAVERRLLISEECAAWQIDAERFKLLTGGGTARIPVEPKFEAQQSLPVTASIMLMANSPPPTSQG